MVVKTELCQFSGLKIYPGHGLKFVRSDAKTFWFISKKSQAMFRNKTNPRKVAWTVLYRRLHKKGLSEETSRKRNRKVRNLQRSIVGASLENIKKIRNQRPEVRAAQREAALREVKEKNKAKAAEKKATAAKNNKAASQKAPVAKNPAGPKGGKGGKGGKR